MIYKFIIDATPNPHALIVKNMNVVIKTKPNLLKLLLAQSHFVTGRSDRSHKKETFLTYPGISTATNILTLGDDTVRYDSSETLLYTRLEANRNEVLGDYGGKPYYGISFVVEKDNQLMMFNEEMEKIEDLKLIAFVIYTDYCRQ